jgi:hypothetical protein
VIQGGDVDLEQQFDFADESWDHSGEFNRSVQQVSGFYRQLGLSLGVLKVNIPQ